MSEFKVGDKVKCVDTFGTSLVTGVVYVVTFEYLHGFVTLRGFKEKLFCCSRFKPVSLEDELEVVQKELVVAEDSVHSLEQRIKALQQVIKERDKPKGRVGIKDPLIEDQSLYFISGSGCVLRTSSAIKQMGTRAMGNLFYDKESAEQYVHDRKQAVLRGDV